MELLTMVLATAGGALPGLLLKRKDVTIAGAATSFALAAVFASESETPTERARRIGNEALEKYDVFAWPEPQP